jgi:hypothetical protein
MNSGTRDPKLALVHSAANRIYLFAVFSDGPFLHFLYSAFDLEGA